jgi:hypothetical protein
LIELLIFALQFFIVGLKGILFFLKQSNLLPKRILNRTAATSKEETAKKE